MLEKLPSLVSCTMLLLIELLHLLGFDCVVHVRAQKPFEVEVNFSCLVALFNICSVQGHCWFEKVTGACACDVVSVQLTRDDPIFAPFRELGSRVWKLVEFKPLCDHCNFLVIQPGMPFHWGIMSMPYRHIKVVDFSCLML